MADPSPTPGGSPLSQNSHSCLQPTSALGGGRGCCPTGKQRPRREPVTEAAEVTTAAEEGDPSGGPTHTCPSAARIKGQQPRTPREGVGRAGGGQAGRKGRGGCAGHGVRTQGPRRRPVCREPAVWPHPLLDGCVLSLHLTLFHRRVDHQLVQLLGLALGKAAEACLGPTPPKGSPRPPAFSCRGRAGAGGCSPAGRSWTGHA